MPTQGPSSGCCRPRWGTRHRISKGQSVPFLCLALGFSDSAEGRVRSSLGDSVRAGAPGEAQGGIVNLPDLVVMSSNALKVCVGLR